MVKLNQNKIILLLRVCYWLGALLDLVSFFQMFFPEFAVQMMHANIEIEPGYIFGMQLGSSLMLAWTILLIWADRKPLERCDILLITEIIIIMNLWVILKAIFNGLLPVNGMLPQLIIMCSLFFLYGGSYILSNRKKSQNFY
jgi:hypothetical protein